MAAGLQVWDATGALIVDTSTRLGRMLGIVTIATATGSVNDPQFATGTPFYIAVPLQTAPAFGPALSFAANAVNWDFQGRPLTSHRLVYGVF